MSSPRSDPVDEGARVADAFELSGVGLRICGGVGVALRCPSASQPPLRRAYADVDTLGRGRERARIVTLLTDELGYEEDKAFNAVHGETRLFFWDAAHDRQLDVFLDRIEMCHRLDLSERIEIDERTLSLADLLLMKLQVIETNRKDLVDIVALLADHAFTDDESGINLRYLTELTSSDWGLWRTVTMVAERAGQFARELEGFGGWGRVSERVQAFLDALESSPKTRRWRLRARVGERKRWYELPEEAH